MLISPHTHTMILIALDGLAIIALNIVIMRNRKQAEKQMKETNERINDLKNHIKCNEEELSKLHQIIDQNTTSFNQRISGLEMRAANDSSDGIKANFDYLNRNLTTYLINKTDEIQSRCSKVFYEINDKYRENKIEIDFLKTKRKEYRHKTNKRIHDLELKVDFMTKVFEERLSPLETITKIYHESTQDDGEDCKDLDLNQLRKMFYILSKLIANVQNKVYKLEGHCFGLSLDQAKQLEEDIQNNHSDKAKQTIVELLCSLQRKITALEVDSDRAMSKLELEKFETIVKEAYLGKDNKDK